MVTGTRLALDLLGIDFKNPRMQEPTHQETQTQKPVFDICIGMATDDLMPSCHCFVFLPTSFPASCISSPRFTFPYPSLENLEHVLQ